MFNSITNFCCSVPSDYQPDISTKQLEKYKKRRDGLREALFVLSSNRCVTAMWHALEIEVLDKAITALEKELRKRNG